MPLTPLEDVGFVLTVLPWQSDGVLAGTTKGLVQLTQSPAGWRPVHFGSAAPEIRTFFRDDKGTLWIGAADGLWRLVDGRVIHEDLGSRGEMLVLSISPAAGGGFWLADGQWVYRWTGGTPVPLTLPPHANFETITFARADRRQRLWIGSGKQIGVIEPDGQFHVLGSSDGLVASSNVALYDMFEDDDGIVWLGTSTGLSRFANGRVTSVGSAQGLPGDRVWSIVQDSMGDLWLSLDRGIVRLSRNDVALAMASSVSSHLLSDVRPEGRTRRLRRSERSIRRASRTAGSGSCAAVA